MFYLMHFSLFTQVAVVGCAFMRHEMNQLPSDWSFIFILTALFAAHSRWRLKRQIKNKSQSSSQ